MPVARSIVLRQFARWQVLGLAAVCALAALAVVGAAPRSDTTSSTPPVALPFATNGAFAPLPGAAVGPSSQGERTRVASRYDRLPLAFEPNRGQFNKTARWVAHGPGYTLSLTRRAAVLSPGTGQPGALSIGLSGANPRAAIVGESALPGKVNYLTGRDSRRWHTNVPTFARVRYKYAWPGIDASFYGNQGQLEYDFDVAPHADPSRIGLSISGAERLRVDRYGNLLMSMPGGSVRQLTPRAFQVVGGTRRGVASRYVVHRHDVRLHVGAYDHRLPLLIDPVLAYSTLVGGPGSDNGFGIAVDGSGAAYLTGSARAGFPTTAGTYQTTNKTSSKPSVFVAKLNPQGTALVYSTYIGGSTFEDGIAIAVDASGAAYVTGSARSTDFPTTPGAFQPTHGAGTDSSDAFVSKLTADGAGLAYSSFLGGAGSGDSESGNAIAVDASGAAYVTGGTNSTDFPTTAGSYQTMTSGPSAAFVSKVDPSGSALEYSTFLGGSDGASGDGIAVDSSGAAYVAGAAAAGFPTTAGAYQAADPTPADPGIFHGFVSKLATDGTGLQYSTYLGASAADSANAVAIDGSGHAYAAGQTQSSDFPTTTGAYQTTYGGGTSDGFVSKLTANGNGLSYSTFLGGAGTGRPESAAGIAVDSSGIAWVTGKTNSTNFPTTAGAFQTADAGESDAFATKLASDGSGLYSTYLGGQCDDVGSAVAVDTVGAAYVTGTSTPSDQGGCTGSPPFPTTPGVLGATSSGQQDAFVSVFSERPAATTGAATDATTSSAILHGSVNPDTHPTTYSFEYGITTAYGATTAGQSAGSDSSDHAVQQTVSGLAPNTTYHFRIVASNSGGSIAGADQVFTTNPLAPAALTLRPSAVAFRSARLNGLLNPNGVETRYHFDYGRTTAYGASTAEQSAGAGGNIVGVSRLVPGLKPGTSYHYRVVATSSGGTSSGGDLRFTTVVLPSLHISHRGTSAAGGRTPIRLTCARSRCKGTMRIEATNLRRRPHKAANDQVGRALNFSLAPGTRKTYLVPLPGKSLQQLRARRSALGRVVVHLGDGRTLRKLITLSVR